MRCAGVAMQNRSVSPSHLGRARSLLSSGPSVRSSRAERAERAVALAAELLALSAEHTHPSDRARADMLSRMMHDPRGQQLTTALTDRVFRSASPRRVLDEVGALLDRFGVPAYMRPLERAALSGVRVLAPLGGSPVAHAIVARVRSEARAVLLDADEEALTAYLAARHREGARVNVNQLGEALLGEREAEARVEKYCALARRPGIDALSVKVSSITSQLNLLAFEATTDLIAERLARVYRATLDAAEAERPLVMLDMEAYAHVELTLSVLARALADPALARVRAGVVVQAYLPDASALFTALSALATARVAHGGLPLRVRFVKGANLAHELVESAKAGTVSPVFARKVEVDAHYKCLLERAITAESTKALHVGVASHNLFDLAYALLLASEAGLDGPVECELLEGMADPMRRALSALGVRVLLYAPVCKEDELNSGIAYLVRRLDENTGSENFLRASFGMAAEGPAFARERARFLESVALIDTVDTTPRRRGDPSFDRTEPGPSHPREQVGERDTDFSRRENRAWIDDALRKRARAPAQLVHSVIDGERVASGALRDGVDPSRPGVVPYRMALADADAIARAIECADRDRERFSQRPPSERAHLLVACAARLRRARAELTAAMVMEAGKRVIEADVEVSEAIDFAEYYRASALRLTREHPVTLTPRGVVLVAPPWNFPLAIAAGGIFAALMAGCRVLFKPPLETPWVGATLAEHLWEAGVPKRALQLVLAADEDASALVRDPRVNAVILTGATSTARLFQQLRPGLRLLAETGGKNAYVISAMSDRELAIRDAVHSAFGHAGQKCSAASLLICEGEVYDDPHFHETLRDAVESLPVGSAWDPRSFVTPLIRPPEGPLARALTTLDPGERWLVTPRIDRDNPRLVSPGVKRDVVQGSFTHRTELFGPVLAVMRAESLAHAIAIANDTGYGLTAGLASLDEREQQLFVDQVRAGNVYVNRTTTGAIVERQPFGGIGKSGFGPGAKAGGPNYVAQLCHVRARGPERVVPQRGTLPYPIEARVAIFEHSLSGEAGDVLRARALDYLAAMRAHFAIVHDPSRVLGQHNRFRYLPCERVLLRASADAALLDIASSCIAADVAGTVLEISMDPRATSLQDASVLGHRLTVETDAQLAERVITAARLRLLGARSEVIDRLNALHGVHIADEPVLGLGRFELLHYLREQSVSIEYHRYGNLGAQ